MEEIFKEFVGYVALGVEFIAAPKDIEKYAEGSSLSGAVMSVKEAASLSHHKARI